MQYLESSIISEVMKIKLKKMEAEFIGLSVGMNICPLCKYQSSKNHKGSAKVFSDGSFKCFSCGEWRRLK